MTEFRTLLANAIGGAPSVEEALRLWQTPPESRPSISEVLSKALVLGNLTGVQACAQLVEAAPLSVEEQGAAIFPWRRSPTSNWPISAQDERAMGRLMATSGLIQPGTTWTSGPGTTRVDYGPLSWCVDRFLVHAAHGFLEGYANPDPDDMAHALAACAEKLTSDRKDGEHWTGLMEALLDKGIDPQVNSKHCRSGMRSSATDYVLYQADKWGRNPLPLIKRVLAVKDDTFTLVNENGRSAMSLWLRSGGDEDIALKLAEGQQLDDDGLECVIHAYLGKTRKMDTEFFAKLPRFVGVPKLHAEDAVWMLRDLCAEMTKSRKPDFPETLIYKAGILVSRCVPEETRKDLVQLWDEMVNETKRWHAANKDQDNNGVMERILSHSQAWLLAHGTPAAEARRTGLRL